MTNCDLSALSSEIRFSTPLRISDLNLFLSKLSLTTVTVFSLTTSSFCVSNNFSGDIFCSTSSTNSSNSYLGVIPSTMVDRSFSPTTSSIEVVLSDISSFSKSFISTFSIPNNALTNASGDVDTSGRLTFLFLSGLPGFLFIFGNLEVLFSSINLFAISWSTVSLYPIINLLSILPDSLLSREL